VSDRVRGISDADRVRSLTFQCDLQRDRIEALEHDLEVLRLRFKRRRGNIRHQLILRLGHKFVILEMLLRRQSVAVDDLANVIYGTASDACRRNVASHVSELRKLIKPLRCAILGLKEGEAYRIIPRHKSLIRQALDAGRRRR
jgi:hypothetical protein